MSFMVVNETENVITLRFRGMVCRTFYAPPGQKQFQIAADVYDYTDWGCGDPVTGTIVAEGKIQFNCA